LYSILNFWVTYEFKQNWDQDPLKFSRLPQREVGVPTPFDLHPTMCPTTQTQLNKGRTWLVQTKCGRKKCVDSKFNIQIKCKMNHGVSYNRI
jgi:hypothetical protein